MFSWRIRKSKGKNITMEEILSFPAPSPLAVYIS
jgi:hypothetical protein